MQTFELMLILLLANPSASAEASVRAGPHLCTAPPLHPTLAPSPALSLELVAGQATSRIENKSIYVFIFRKRQFLGNRHHLSMFIGVYWRFLTFVHCLRKVLGPFVVQFVQFGRWPPLEHSDTRFPWLWFRWCL